MNEEIARQKSLFENDEQRLQAQLMTRPIESRDVFGYFGLLIGSMPLLTVTFRLLTAPSPIVFGLFLGAAGILTGLIGQGVGRRYIPRALKYISSFAMPNRIALVILLGLAWGAFSGAVGGLVIFLIGAIPGAIIGGIVGAITVPIMVALHSSVRIGDFIETKHFLPIAFAIIFSICAYILGV